ncbi:MAG: IPExxxVDY family protein [Flavobacteriaceae bacterium]|nr:IPExxxVDY family protein [Flavobacteriaceae bacterium]
MSKVVVLNYQNDHDYNLVGLHTSLEDYRLAFFLNSNLNIQLKRNADDLDFYDGHAQFALYTYDCSKDFITWSLIANKYNYVSKDLTSTNLFSEQYQTSVLIPEKKQVDYFLKIEADMHMPKLETILSTINNIKNILTSYSINPQTLKSRDFLIF